MKRNAWLTSCAGICLAILLALVGFCLWQARGLQLRGRILRKQFRRLEEFLHGGAVFAETEVGVRQAETRSKAS